MTRDPADDPRNLSTDAVDDVLEGIADALAELGAETPDATSDSGVDEGTPGRRDPYAPSWPDPGRALTLARSRLVGEAGLVRAETAREFAAWWADLASVALADTAAGLPVPVIRAAVGDPFLDMSQRDLEQLPGRTFREEYFIADQPTADYRRDQIWGKDWTVHKVPPLPPAAEVSEQLIACELPESRVREVRQAREAIAEALAASKHSREQGAVEIDVLWATERTDHLTDLLANYARLLTDCLRQVWSRAA